MLKVIGKFVVLKGQIKRSLARLWNVGCISLSRILDGARHLLLTQKIQPRATHKRLKRSNRSLRIIIFRFFCLSSGVLLLKVCLSWKSAFTHYFFNLFKKKTRKGILSAAINAAASNRLSWSRRYTCMCHKKLRSEGP